MMASERLLRPNQDLKLMDQVRQVLRYHRYRYRTEQTYCKWILGYIRYHGGTTPPKLMGKAVYEHVFAATRRRALKAIDFLYHKVLGRDICGSISPLKAKRRKRPPVVTTQQEV